MAEQSKTPFQDALDAAVARDADRDHVPPQLCEAQPPQRPTEPSCGLAAGHVVRAGSQHMNYAGLQWSDPTNDAQARADAIKDARLSTLQAELDQWKRRALAAEAVAEGVTSALETLFNAVPRRLVLPDYDQTTMGHTIGPLKALPCQHLHHDPSHCPMR